MDNDIKHDNIFFSTTMTAGDIEVWVSREPSLQHPPEALPDGAVQAAVSQPLSMISEDEAMQATYLLADFGHGMCCRIFSIQMLINIWGSHDSVLSKNQGA